MLTFNRKSHSTGIKILTQIIQHSKQNCCDDIFNVFKRTLEFISDAVALLPVVKSAFSREFPFQNYLHYIAMQNLISGTLEIWIS